MQWLKSADLALQSPTKSQRVSLSLCLFTSSAIDGEYSTQPLDSKITYLIQHFFPLKSPNIPQLFARSSDLSDFIIPDDVL
jgi:hypothetical protein